jgi:hypothetical protein
MSKVTVFFRFICGTNQETVPSSQASRLGLFLLNLSSGGKEEEEEKGKVVPLLAVTPCCEDVW